MLRHGNKLSETHKLLINTYNSEYQSMQTRITTYITIQLGIWPSLVVILSFVASIYMHHKIDQAIFYWGSLLIVIGGLQIYYFALHEVYNHTLYIEAVLKPNASKILRSKSFWNWEKHLKKTGKSNPAWYGDFVAMLLPLLGFGYAIFKRISSWSPLDYAMATICVLALIFLPLQGAIKSYKIRKKFESNI